MPDRETDQYLCFRAGGAGYALPFSGICAITEGAVTSPLPCENRWLWGVLYWKGVLYPAVDFTGGRGTLPPPTAILYQAQEVTAAIFAEHIETLTALTPVQGEDGAPAGFCTMTEPNGQPRLVPDWIQVWEGDA